MKNQTRAGYPVTAPLQAWLRFAGFAWDGCISPKLL